MSTTEPPRVIPDDLIPPGKAARLIHVHVATIYRWILEGRLPAWRLRGRCGVKGGRRLSKADVLSLLEPEPLPVKGQTRAESKVEQQARKAWTDEVLRRTGVIR